MKLRERVSHLENATRLDNRLNSIDNRIEILFSQIQAIVEYLEIDLESDKVIAVKRKGEKE